jgi:hypothetical protein
MGRKCSEQGHREVKICNVFMKEGKKICRKEPIRSVGGKCPEKGSNRMHCTQDRAG